MPIHIVNLGTNKSPTGEHSYELRINSRVICNFTHQRELGLAECLRRAAEAVDAAEAINLSLYLEAAFNLSPQIECGGGK